jgi:hypothetical protein
MGGNGFGGRTGRLQEAPTMFIDVHVHTSRYPDFHYPGKTEGFATPEQLTDMYDEVGISRGVLLPLANIENVHAVQSNEEVLQIVDEHPDRFIPFCNIDPRLMFNTPEADLSYAIEHYRDKGCRGIGEICANLPWDDPRVDNLFAHAERCEMPVTFHIATQQGGTYGLVDQKGLPGLERALQVFPDLLFFGHSQAFWSHISADVTDENWGGYPDGSVAEGGRLVELFETCPNLYGDLSAGSGFNAVSRDPEFGCDFIERFQDRLLFGTDVCGPSNRKNVLVNLKSFVESALADNNISQQAFDRVTHENARRLLKL